MKSLIVYTYFKSPSSNINLTFFSKRELKYNPNVDYIIVINGYECDVDIPILGNLHVIKRENRGFDFGGHSVALEYVKNKNIEYDYYFFMNSGVIGPILPHYWPQDIHWTEIFMKKITDKIKLVGTTIVCHPDHKDYGGFGPRVEGFFFMTDKFGLKVLLDNGTIFRNHPSKYHTIRYGEYGLSICMLENGYGIDCMIPEYQGIDWTDKTNWTKNNNIHPSRPNSFYGRSLNPYDLIFHKWYWHDIKEYVNFDIIKHQIAIHK
jgi:hypothetical protein